MSNAQPVAPSRRAEHLVSVRLSADEFAAVSRAAETEDRSRASVVRRAVRAVLAEPAEGEG
jgi:predicted transcriptional regulator